MSNFMEKLNLTGSRKQPSPTPPLKMTSTIKKATENAKWRMFPHLLEGKLERLNSKVQELSREVGTLEQLIAAQSSLPDQINDLSSHSNDLRYQIKNLSAEYNALLAEKAILDEEWLQISNKVEVYKNDIVKKKMEIPGMNKVMKKIHLDTILEERWIPILQDQVEQLQVRVTKNMQGLQILSQVKKKRVESITPELTKLEEMSQHLQDKQSKLGKSQNDVEILAKLIFEAEKGVKQQAIDLEKDITTKQEALQFALQEAEKYQQTAIQLQEFMLQQFPPE